MSWKTREVLKICPRNAAKPQNMSWKTMKNVLECPGIVLELVSKKLLDTLHQVTVKKSTKNVVLAFYGVFYTENWAKNKENPLFLLKGKYLRITKKYRSQCRKVLET